MLVWNYSALKKLEIEAFGCQVSNPCFRVNFSTLACVAAPSPDVNATMGIM